jgi:hypothetical protein
LGHKGKGQRWGPHLHEQIFGKRGNFFSFDFSTEFKTPIDKVTALNREDGTRIVSFQDRSHVMTMERHDVTFFMRQAILESTPFTFSPSFQLPFHAALRLGGFSNQSG